MILHQSIKRTHHRVHSIAAAVALLAGSVALAPAHAEGIDVKSIVQGWVNSNGGANGAEATTNMYTGVENGTRYNSWIAFYIPPGSYSFASLSFKPDVYGDYGSNLIGIYDVAAPMQSFLNGWHPGVDVYQDLGSGAQYGTANLFNTATTVNLSGNAVYDINAAAGSYLVMGFSNLTLNGIPADQDPGGIYINGVGRGQSPLQLHLEIAPVPEPGTWAMLSGGLGLLGFIARRRRQQTA
jgi:hypothetical protein